MKCVKSNETGHVRRMDDEKAVLVVKLGGWKFCPKSEWKTQERKTVVSVNTGNVTKEQAVAFVTTLVKTNTKVKKSGKNKGETK